MKHSRHTIATANGSKTYLQGPAVVFPSPTETFVLRDGARKYRAIELNENSGIYVKVIAPYTNDKGVSHDVGDELLRQIAQRRERTRERVVGGRIADDRRLYDPRCAVALVRVTFDALHHADAADARRWQPEPQARALDRT